MAGERRGSGSASRRKLTWEDLAALPEDMLRHELLDGKHVVTPSPFVRHQRVSGNLQFLLEQHVRSRDLGAVLAAPTDVILDTHTVVVPDLLFVNRERTFILDERAIVGPPDLLVEILSPGTARRDRTTKLRLYARFGVPHYWILDPATREFFAFTLATAGTYGPAAVSRGEAVLDLPVPAGLRLDLSLVWA